MLKIMAVSIPSTYIFWINRSAIKIISPLITNENKPNVMSVIGKENNDKIGLIKVLSKPKTMANTIAVPILSK